MIFDERRSLRTINEAPNNHIIKIFFYLALNQPQEGILGFKINRKQLQFDLKLCQTNFSTAISWLKDNICIHELKFGEDSDFMVNPYIVMNNGDRDSRIAEWNRRMRLDNAKILRNRKLKRLRELKKQNQQ